MPAPELHVLNTAELTLPYTPVVDLELGTFTIAVPAYLVDHPEGAVLIDTGLNHNLVRDPDGYGAGHLAGMVGQANIEEYDPLPAQLERVGYVPDDVDYVILTHLHFDHTGYVDHFETAEFVVQRDELQYGWWPEEGQFPFFLFEDFATLREYDVTAIDGEYDLFGDGTVVCLPTPGHTPGHQSVELSLGEEGTVLLASDVAYCREAYEKELWMTFDWSIEQTLESIRAIKHRAAVENATVSILHEQTDLERLQ